MKPTHLDLFSGIGGFSIAAENCGFQTIGFSEIDPYASAILKKHWPDIKNYGDIKTADFSELRGKINLLTGGIPCQPFSVAGKRRGREDDRHLWPEMLRVIDEIKPHYILGENVAGFVGMELDNVLIDLEAIGYATWPLVIPACAVDAPHRRDRVWIMAVSSNSRAEGVREREKSTIEDVANARRQSERIESNGFNHQFQDGSKESFRTETRNGFADSSKNDANSVCQRLEGQRKIESRTQSKFGDISNPSWWEIEPSICRVVNELPLRSHRLRCLGNSIVPKVAEILLKEIFKCIML